MLGSKNIAPEPGAYKNMDYRYSYTIQYTIPTMQGWIFCRLYKYNIK